MDSRVRRKRKGKKKDVELLGTLHGKCCVFSIHNSEWMKPKEAKKMAKERFFALFLTGFCFFRFFFSTFSIIYFYFIRFYTAPSV